MDSKSLTIPEHDIILNLLLPPLNNLIIIYIHHPSCYSLNRPLPTIHPKKQDHTANTNTITITQTSNHATPSPKPIPASPPLTHPPSATALTSPKISNLKKCCSRKRKCNNSAHHSGAKADAKKERSVHDGTNVRQTRPQT